MKAIIYTTSGKKKSEMELPAVFSTPYRPDLIKRAFISALTARLQPWGANKNAGKRTSGEGIGTGFGMARIKRVKGGAFRSGRKGRPYAPKFRSFPAAGVAVFAPQVMGGRRAHPPKAESILHERINKKERQKAVQSAIAATANEEIVRSRGHKFELSLPLIVEDSLQDVTKAKQAKEILESLKLTEELDRSGERSIRAGKGKTRSRRYRTRVGPLIVVAEDKGVSKAVASLGLDVVNAKQLNTELLSPGAHGARLVIWTESAIRSLGA